MVKVVLQLAEKTVVVSKEELSDTLFVLFKAAGVSAEDAQLCADVLIDAELRGIGSHGARFMDSLLARLIGGGLNPAAAITIIRDKPALLLLDANGGLGHPAMIKAIKLAMPKAARSGSCAVGIRNANHFGHAGYYAELAAKEGFICMVTTNSTPLMPVWGGLDLCLGTNPVAFGLPASGDPIVLDMATSAIARGKIFVSARKGEPIQEGIALDKDGNPTTDAAEAIEGIILPNGHKGSGLAFVFDILSGVLTGAQFGANIVKLQGNTTTSQDLGFFAFLINVADFMEMDEYLSKMEEVADFIHNSRKMPGVDTLYLPGERSAALRDKNSSTGLSVPEDLMENLASWKKRLNLN